MRGDFKEIMRRRTRVLEKVKKKSLDPYSMANLIIKMLGLEN
ncbi:hypothetical protein LCGC14_1371680 [marine sediment metagenome]|uniref:Uncharacterized protein n=1 Tax=marine sediment metagenome TaxID=412755 RepID=A0A0F9KRA6_9ZZZZ